MRQPTGASYTWVRRRWLFSDWAGERPTQGNVLAQVEVIKEAGVQGEIGGKDGRYRGPSGYKRVFGKLKISRDL